MLSYIFTGLLAHNLLNIATAQSKPYVLLNQHPLSPLASPRQTAAAAHLSAAVAAAVGGQTNPNWLAAAHGQSVTFPVVMLNTLTLLGLVTVYWYGLCPKHERVSG